MRKASGGIALAFDCISEEELSGALSGLALGMKSRTMW